MTPAAFAPALLDEIRERFEGVDSCPEQGPRIFFENAGGALTLKSVVETSARYAAIPDNPGRANPGGAALTALITRAQAEIKAFLNAPGGQVFIGESGTELLFRLIRNACLGTTGTTVLGSTVEHPATRSACARWAPLSGKRHVLIDHDAAAGLVTPAAYAAAVTPETCVSTILHTSPVSGMGMDLPGITAAIRAVAPECFIIVDGIQHAAHGGIDIASCDIDGYVISPYKMFSRHGYGLAWISDRMAALPHDGLDGAAPENWSLGTRDAGSYATMLEVISYLDWLGAQAGGGADRPSRFLAAAKAISGHEAALCKAMIHGTGNLKGLAEMDAVTILGGPDNPAREGLVSITVDGIDAEDVVARLNAAGIRTHTRKADLYSGNILTPLGVPACIRVSLCHYNSLSEVATFLTAMQDIAP